MNKYSGNKYIDNDHYIVAWLYCLAFAKGLQEAGRDLNVDSFIQGMERIADYDMGGLTGNITYSSRRHVGSVACKMMKFDLKIKGLSPWRTPGLTPDLLSFPKNFSRVSQREERSR